jgi:Na+/proline symporter
MSTVSTLINWGASYLTNDIYRRFLRPEATQRQLVRAGRIATVCITALGAVAAFVAQDIVTVFRLVIAIGTGPGMVLILRWYWWRINAWSEVTAMAAAFVLSLGLQFGAGLDPGDPRGFAWLMLLTVSGTTVVWLVVTYLTPPEPEAHLRRFYERVRPGGWGWKEVAGRAPEEGPGYAGLVTWAVGCAVVYLGLFGTGYLFLGRPWRGVILVGLAIVLTAWVVRRTEAVEVE